LRVLEENLEQMLRRQPLMAAPQRHRLRRLQKSLRAIGVFLHFHDQDLASARWRRRPAFGSQQAAELSMIIHRWARILIEQPRFLDAPPLQRERP